MRDSITYSADSKVSIFGGILSMFRDYIDGFGLAKRLFIRDTLAQYRQSVLGFSWAIIVPLSSTLVWVLLNKSGILSVDDTGIPYPVFVLCGVLLWQAFLEALNAPLSMFSKSRSILTKINFPKEALIMAGFMKVLLNLGIKLVLFVCVLIYYQAPIGIHYLYAIPAVVMVLFIGITLGIFITPFGALYGDVQRLVASTSQLFFFLTPIIYPARTEGVFATIDAYNPVAVFVGAARYSLTGAGTVDLGVYVAYSVLGVILFLFSMALYRVSMPIIIERIGS